MDKLRLEIKAMDELHPDLRDLVESMNRLSLLPSDFDGKRKVTCKLVRFKHLFKQIIKMFWFLNYKAAINILHKSITLLQNTICY